MKVRIVLFQTSENSLIKVLLISTVVCEFFSVHVRSDLRLSP